MYSGCGELTRFLDKFVIMLTLVLSSVGRPNEFKVLNLLSRSLTELSLHHQVEFKAMLAENSSFKIAEPQVLGVNQQQELKLPSLSTDPTQINPVDLAAFDLASSNSVSSKKAEGLLPLPQARIVSPQEKTASTEPKDISPVSSLPGAETDVLTQFSPQTTRFGRDRYDKELFSGKPDSLPNEEQRLTESGIIPVEESLLKKEKDNLQTIMGKIAEKTEEIEAFRLVDYYDLRSLFQTYEKTLNAFEEDEIDLRFFENAQTIYNRFGSKDSGSDKLPFENFLKRMQPYAELQAYRGSYFKAGRQRKAIDQPN